MTRSKGEGRSALLSARGAVADDCPEALRRELESIAAEKGAGRRVRALALNDLGVIAFGDRAVERALTLFEAALAIDDDLSFAHLNLGLVLESLERYHEALVSLRAAAWCDSAEPGLRDALERVAVGIGIPDLADDVLAEVQEDHRLVVATEADLGFMRNDFHVGRRNAMRALYRRVASLSGFGRILEWDCETGVGAAWMAEAGADVHGVCLSAESLLYARRRHACRGTRFTRDLDFAGGQTYDVVTSRGPAACSATLATLSILVASGGRLIIPESWTANGVEIPGFEAGEWLGSVPRSLPGYHQRLRVWTREKVAGLLS